MSDAYARAGVDIEAGNEAVRRYRQIAEGYRHPLQVGGIGGFSGIFRIPGDERRGLVGSTDGVGTKILIAAATGRYDGVGRDLVNHCVNDILVTGAAPLFFLDYLAVGKLDPEIAAAIVGGVERACRAHEMALLGGETAEMPGLYDPRHFDLAGTIVGIVDLDDVPDPQTVRPTDAILGLPAVGLHTNGYTLARKLVREDEYDLTFDGMTFAEALLAEHASYYRPVQAIRRAVKVKAMAHITGGGLLENVPRTLPPDCKAVFEQSRWTVPPIFRELIARGGLSHEERYRTFNMGVGFTLVVAFADVADAIAAAPEARVVGFIDPRGPGDPPVVVHPARGD